MTFKDYLHRLADIWTAATGRSHVALGGLVVSDGKFFARTHAGGSFSTATFERFLTFFRDGGSWPDNVIPIGAAELLERLDNIATDATASTGKAMPLSRDTIIAAAGTVAPGVTGTERAA